MRRNQYLNEFLNFRIRPHAEKSQQTQTQRRKKNGLSFHEAATFDHINSAIVEDVPVNFAIQLVHNMSHQVIASWLQENITFKIRNRPSTDFENSTRSS
jgi:hypothetical protein